MLDTKNNNVILNADVIESGHKPVLVPGASTNIYCNHSGIKIVGSKLISAVVRLQAEYDVNFFGFKKFHQETYPITFSWMPSPTEDRHQWIKGDL